MELTALSISIIGLAIAIWALRVTYKAYYYANRANEDTQKILMLNQKQKLRRKLIDESYQLLIDKGRRPAKDYLIEKYSNLSNESCDHTPFFVPIINGVYW